MPDTQTVYSTLVDGSFYPGDYVKSAFKITNGEVELPVNIAERVIREYPRVFSATPFKKSPPRRTKSPNKIPDPEPNEAEAPEPGDMESP